MPSEKVTHGRWVEQDYERDQVGKNITDLLLLKIRSNVLRRVSDGSENSLVETMAHLIEASLYQLPIEYDVEVIRGVHLVLILQVIVMIIVLLNILAFYLIVNFLINIGSNFILSGLIQEESIKYYMPIIKAKIPFHHESVEEVEEFVHSLMTLQVRSS